MMKTEQLSLVEMPPKDNTPKNAKLRWENGFQRWSDEQAGGNDYYGKCGYSDICDYCTDNIKGRPCVRALNEMCRDRNIKLDYTKKTIRRYGIYEN